MKRIVYIFIFLISIFITSNSVFAWSKYEIGKKVTYNGVDYYVIANSDATNDMVTMLKAEPLTTDEILKYSAGTGAKIHNENGYTLMEYHSSSNEYSTKPQ